MGHSRNFTLSPETTSCDSGDVESDYSGVDPEGSVHSSSRGICPAMPVLEDGLSSGEEIKQITSIIKWKSQSSEMGNNVSALNCVQNYT